MLYICIYQIFYLPLQSCWSSKYFRIENHQLLKA
nr:MAG TPA: hypothetical protein [Caudoviricetes sp.]